jgi:polysaccharide export outer membrane protein
MRSKLVETILGKNRIVCASFWVPKRATAAALVLVSAGTVPMAQQNTAPPGPATIANAPAAVPSGVATVPADYLIGPDDVLSVMFWRDKDMSTEVVVRPDGKISLPLLNDVQASGLSPEQLRVALTEAAGKLIEEPNISVVVKAINSRKVFVTGQVNKPGPYPLSAPTTVLQLIATAGGLMEYADSKNVRVMRTENGKPVSYKFNYKDVIKGKNLKQNIELKPGDTIIVP